MRQRKTYYFEVEDADELGDFAAQPLRRRSLGTGSYRNRPGLTPIMAFQDTRELIADLASSRRRHRRFHEAPTQADVAEAMGASKSFVARIESECTRPTPRVPTMETLKSYAAALGYDLRIVCIPRVE